MRLFFPLTSQLQRIELPSVFLPADAGIDSGCVDIAMSQDVRQMFKVMLCMVEAHGKQMAQVMWKHLFRQYSCCLAELLHTAPYGESAQGLALSVHKYASLTDAAALAVIPEPFPQPVRQEYRPAFSLASYPCIAQPDAFHGDEPQLANADARGADRF